jgi:hypothetical protein
MAVWQYCSGSDGFAGSHIGCQSADASNDHGHVLPERRFSWIPDLAARQRSFGSDGFAKHCSVSWRYGSSADD